MANGSTGSMYNEAIMRISRCRVLQRLSDVSSTYQHVGACYIGSKRFASSAIPEQRKRLDVAIVGLPNAGKSQLLNALTQSSVSAVSRKRHTTREGVLGARTVDDTQLLFVDTPGFLRLNQARKEGLQGMVSSASEVANVDYTLLVVDAARALTSDARETTAELMLQAIESVGRVEICEDDQNIDMTEPKPENTSRRDGTSRFSIVLNKVDLVYPKSDLLEIAMELSDVAESLIKAQVNDEIREDEFEDTFPNVFYISARKEEGVDDVLNFLLEKATPCRSWDMDPEQSTSLTEEERVEEIVREKLYRCLHKEVPYNIAQRNLLFATRKDLSSGTAGFLIHQELIVKTKSHQDFVFGSGGQTLERIRETAERDLKKIFGCKVVLQLQVKLLKKSRQRNWSI